MATRTQVRAASVAPIGNILRNSPTAVASVTSEASTGLSPALLGTIAVIIFVFVALLAYAIYFVFRRPSRDRNIGKPKATKHFENQSQGSALTNQVFRGKNIGYGDEGDYKNQVAMFDGNVSQASTLKEAKVVMNEPVVIHTVGRFDIYQSKNFIYVNDDKPALPEKVTSPTSATYYTSPKTPVYPDIKQTRKSTVSQYPQNPVYQISNEPVYKDDFTIQMEQNVLSPKSPGRSTILQRPSIYDISLSPIEIKGENPNAIEPYSLDRSIAPKTMSLKDSPALREFREKQKQKHQQVTPRTDTAQLFPNYSDSPLSSSASNRNQTPTPTPTSVNIQNRSRSKSDAHQDRASSVLLRRFSFESLSRPESRLSAVLSPGLQNKQDYRSQYYSQHSNLSKEPRKSITDRPKMFDGSRQDHNSDSTKPSSSNLKSPNVVGSNEGGFQSGESITVRTLIRPRQSDDPPTTAESTDSDEVYSNIARNENVGFDSGDATDGSNNLIKEMMLSGDLFLVKSIQQTREEEAILKQKEEQQRKRKELEERNKNPPVWPTRTRSLSRSRGRSLSQSGANTRESRGRSLTQARG